MRCVAAVFGLVLGSASLTGASTLNEADMPGGAFGASWNTPTTVGAGVTAITGTGNQNWFDNFVLTALPAGAQTISLTFTAPAGIGWSYAAGGNILWATQPFRWGWDGTTLGTVHTDYYTRSRSIDLVLGPSFSGSLWLALNFTYGSNLAYTVGLPSNAVVAPAPTPAPVPLPAGLWLIGSALGIIGLAARRGRRQTAARKARG
jgi:hypothetical protein